MSVTRVTASSRRARLSIPFLGVAAEASRRRKPLDGFSSPSPIVRIKQ